MSRLLRALRRPSPAPDVVAVAAEIVDMEAERRRIAFERALAELDRPRLTTEAILDGYLAAVTS